MSEKIRQINDSNFDSMVLFPRKPAVVFFTADWSDASDAAFPIVESAAQKYKAKAAVYEMNVDENSIIATAYGVRRLPAILTFTDGRLGEKYFGFISGDALDEKIEKLTAQPEIYGTVAAFSKRLAARARCRISLLLSELL